MQVRVEVEALVAVLGASLFTTKILVELGMRMQRYIDADKFQDFEVKLEYPLDLVILTPAPKMSWP